MTDLDSLAALNWSLGRGTGASSKALVAGAFGLTTDGSYPHDGSDFDRCERAMNMIPGLRERLPMMAKVNAYWAALVPEWANIANAPDKYAAIQRVIRPVQDADPRVFRFDLTK